MNIQHDPKITAHCAPKENEKIENNLNELFYSKLSHSIFMFLAN